MGKPGRVNDAAVLEQINIVRQACVARQMPLGIFGVDAAAVQSSIKAGFRLITVGMDTLMLIQSAQALLAALKG
jgi:2-keto-3-deoxy-L-rhamnonate aldolase RhmA